MRPHKANFLDHGLLRDVQAIHAYSAAVNWRLTAVTAPFVMVNEDQLNAARRTAAYARSPYHDLVATHDLPNGCQTVLAAGASGMTAMWTHRGQAKGVTSADELDLFLATAPAVLKAIALEEAIGRQGASMVAGTLETMQAAAFILDSKGRVMAMTPGAARLASRRDVINVAGGALRATDRLSDNRLQAAVAEALVAGPQPVARRLWLRDPARMHTGMAGEIFSLKRRDWNFDFLPCAIVALRPPGGIDQAAAALLRQSFDLSPTEADVTIAIVQGHNRAEIARARGVSLETINAQLKSIYRKTDVRREAELVAMVIQLTG
jgi:DNA-binding CsgD family transcriptional regulator